MFSSLVLGRVLDERGQPIEERNTVPEQFTHRSARTQLWKSCSGTVLVVSTIESGVKTPLPVSSAPPVFDDLLQPRPLTPLLPHGQGWLCVPSPKHSVLIEGRTPLSDQFVKLPVSPSTQSQMTSVHVPAGPKIELSGVLNTFCEPSGQGAGGEPVFPKSWL